MIHSIHIENFKSIVNLNLDLGRYNVLVGENGCGKSNILEATAFGAAASANKLDFEFLGSRGVRATNPEFMYSAFRDLNKRKNISISYKTDRKNFDHTQYLITNDNDNPRKWINVSRDIFSEFEREELLKVILSEYVRSDNEDGTDNSTYRSEETTNELKDFFTRITNQYGKGKKMTEVFDILFSAYINDKYQDETISNFIIYSPEQSSLRKFEETTQIRPLGIRGEGLFQYLKELTSDEQSQEVVSEIKDNLLLLDWYETFEIPDGLLNNEFSLKIRDRHLDESLHFFDQRSTNEGFLYLLFYSTLFISKDTPTFFAIDNIDASLNPKLCIELTKKLTDLAKKHQKQVIVTTQNPAVLDGLNLKDDTQRLFVISRNEEGHTRAERIKDDDRRTMKLSDIWTKGFIGGLPSNF